MVISNEVRERIYEHISREYEMGLPPHESWESITDDEDWVVEVLESGISLDDLRGKIFDEVYEKWSEENDEEDK